MTGVVREPDDANAQLCLATPACKHDDIVRFLVLLSPDDKTPEDCSSREKDDNRRDTTTVNFRRQVEESIVFSLVYF